MLRKLLRRSPVYRPYVRWKLATSSSAREEHFTGFWRDNVWGDSESRSGSGSGLQETAALRQRLPSLLAELDVHSLLDVPCGDFAWMRYVDLGGVDYIGGDIVGALIDELNRDFSAPGRRFMRLDVISDPLPAVDAVMIRDLFLHLPTARVQEALASVRRSSARYLLASNYTSVTMNVDVEMGQHRFLNLTLPPFSLPPPVTSTADGIAERADKTMSVWRL